MRRTHDSKPLCAVGAARSQAYPRCMKTFARFPRLLAATSLAPLLAAVALWVATGANIGWTKTSAVVMQHDEVTGIDYPVHQPAFVAGVEVLAIGVAVGMAVAAVGLVSRRFSPARG